MADLMTAGPAHLRRSPLADLTDRLRETAADPIRVSEVPFTKQIGLRAAPGTDAHAALAAATGVGLPGHVGAVAGGPSDVAVLWLAPDEFLLVAAPDRHDLVPALTAALGSGRGQVVDLSANRTIIEVSGAGARQVLDKGVPADLHPRAFPQGHAITGTVQGIPVLLWRTGPSTYRVMPRASFALHVADWLLDASREFRTGS
jgi:sarcosine oxidase, subunit gamma